MGRFIMRTGPAGDACHHTRQACNLQAETSRDNVAGVLCPCPLYIMLEPVCQSGGQRAEGCAELIPTPPPTVIKIRRVTGVETWA